jgi:hypothetical protein
MRGVFDTIFGLFDVLLIVMRSGFRLNGAYWRWRTETAFGQDRAHWPPRRQRLAATLEYARWVHRMKRAR